MTITLLVFHLCFEIPFYVSHKINKSIMFCHAIWNIFTHSSSQWASGKCKCSSLTLLLIVIISVTLKGGLAHVLADTDISSCKKCEVMTSLNMSTGGCVDINITTAPEDTPAAEALFQGELWAVHSAHTHTHTAINVQITSYYSCPHAQTRHSLVNYTQIRRDLAVDWYPARVAESVTLYLLLHPPKDMHLNTGHSFSIPHPLYNSLLNIVLIL